MCLCVTRMSNVSVCCVTRVGGVYVCGVRLVGGVQVCTVTRVGDVEELCEDSGWCGYLRRGWVACLLPLGCPSVVRMTATHRLL